MRASDSSPVILLHHDGELADIRALLEELAVPFDERLGSDPSAVDDAACDVLIASSRRMFDHRRRRGRGRPRLIAVLEDASRTLRSHLQRMSVEWMIQRPVHPAALRLLLLHLVYRGPERRRRERVAIGAAVRLRSGLLPRRATLADCSLRGCRLLSATRLARDRSVRIRFPARMAGGRSFSVKGQVVRSGPAESAFPGVTLVAVRFEPLSGRCEKRLQKLLDAYASGPATLPRQVASGETHRTAPAGASRAAPEGIEPAAAARAPEASSAQAGPDPLERRQSERHAYERRVVALGEQATRVLLGRDISTGGMRIDAGSGLALGDRLQLALHTSGRSEPLVVCAQVCRDDGEAGAVLSFEPLSEPLRQELARQLEQLPLLAGDDEAGAGIVISEILQRQAV